MTWIFFPSQMNDLPDAAPYVWTGLHEQDSGIWQLVASFAFQNQ